MIPPVNEKMPPIVSTNLIKNHTWDFVELPEGKSVVAYKRVFKVKHTADGRLVAQGFLQEAGQDCKEIFVLSQGLAPLDLY